MKTLKLGLIATALVGASVATAQTSGPTGFSARLGAAFSDGESLFSFGGDYKFNTVSINPTANGYNTYLGISADYYGRDSNFNIPIALTYNVRANQALFMAGVGLDISKFGGDTKAGLGFQIGAQYDFANAGTGQGPIYVSAKYFFARENEQRALQTTIGYRF